MDRPLEKLPKGVPNCLKKRALLNDKEMAPETAKEYGEKFLALGWLEDALEFYQKADYREGLEQIKAQCLQAGDAYLLARLGRDLSPDDWRRVADQALALGKLHFAARAYKMAGDPDKAEAVEGLTRDDAPVH